MENYHSPDRKMQLNLSSFTATLLVSVLLLMVSSSRGHKDPRRHALRRAVWAQKRMSGDHSGGSSPTSSHGTHGPAWHEHPMWNHPALLEGARLWPSPSSSPTRGHPRQGAHGPNSHSPKQDATPAKLHRPTGTPHAGQGTPQTHKTSAPGRTATHTASGSSIVAQGLTKSGQTAQTHTAHQTHQQSADARLAHGSAASKSYTHPEVPHIHDIGLGADPRLAILRASGNFKAAKSPMKKGRPFGSKYPRKKGKGGEAEGKN